LLCLKMLLMSRKRQNYNKRHELKFQVTHCFQANQEVLRVRQIQ